MAQISFAGPAEEKIIAGHENTS